MLKKIILLCWFVIFCSTIYAATVSVTFNFGSYIQAGSFTNNSSVGLNVTQFVLSLGTAANGIGTWDTSVAAGGIASDYISGSSYYQTITWSGLAIGKGSSFSYSGLDFDDIVTLSPLSVAGGGSTPGSTLARAYVRLTFSDGSVFQQSLLQITPESGQTFTLTGSSTPVPEPNVLILMFVGLLFVIRKKN